QLRDVQRTRRLQLPVKSSTLQLMRCHQCAWRIGRKHHQEVLFLSECWLSVACHIPIGTSFCHSTHQSATILLRVRETAIFTTPTESRECGSTIGNSPSLR